jgi:hypothetical protein
MDYIALWPAFGISPAIREKLMRISPATIDRALKNDRTTLALKGKSLTKPAPLLKHRIHIRTFYTSPERKLPGFIQIDTVHHCGQAASGQYILTPTPTDVASGWICLYSLFNKAYRGPLPSSGTSTRTSPFPLRSSTAITAAGLSTMSPQPRLPHPLYPFIFRRSVLKTLLGIFS